MVDPEQIRVTDAERHEVLEQLGEHLALGSLTHEEFESRSELALRATTRGDLGALTHDLPTSEPVRRPAPAPGLPARTSSWQVAVMGGSKKKGRWRVADRFVSVAVMGGAEIDLRSAELPGGEVRIVAVAVMGSVEVYVPDTVDVEVSGIPIMGDHVERGSQRRPRPGAPVVRVQAYSVMGGVTVWRLPAETEGLPLKAAVKAAKQLERGRHELE